MPPPRLRVPWIRVLSSVLLLLSSAIVIAEGGRELRALRPIQLEHAPQIAAEIEEHMSALTKHGTNRRVPCSAGNMEARSYIASALAQAGVEPAASSFAHSNTWWDSFFDVVSGSVEPSCCAHGIANVIGLVRGTELPDEVIMYVAHYDGARDARDGQDQYDDAAAVAVGLVLASRLAASPPKRTIVFFFGDAELGWSNIGDTPQPFNCIGNGDDDEMNADVPGWVNMTARGCSLNGGKYPIGIVDWLDRPGSFIDPIHVKLAIAVDSLGMPMVDSKPDPIAVIGAEATPGLSDLLKASWDPRGPQTFFLPQRPVIETSKSSSSSEALDFCNGIGMSGCLTSRGVPSVWYTQPGSEMVKRASRLNPRLTAETAVPKPDAIRLGHVHDALLGTIQSLASSPDLSGYEIRAQEDTFDPLSHNYALRDAEEILAGFDRLAEVALAAGDRRAEGVALRLGARLRREVFQQIDTEADILQDKEQVLLRQAGIALAELWVGARS